MSIASHMKTLLRRVGLSAFGLVALYIAILAFPEPAFRHHVSYQNYEVWSDEPIPASIAEVLDDSTRRLNTSDLYKPDWTIRVFICNAPWRLWLYGMHFDSGIGGSADGMMTQNIYISAADIPNNAVRMPEGKRLLDPELRPLSYFIAHEATHILSARTFGRFYYVNHPEWLTEGFADYVAKGGQFDAAENLKLYKVGALDWPPRRYRRFHLQLDYLVRQKGMSFRQLFDDSPDEATVLRMLDATK